MKLHITNSVLNYHKTSERNESEFSGILKWIWIKLKTFSFSFLRAVRQPNRNCVVPTINPWETFLLFRYYENTLKILYLQIVVTSLSVERGRGFSGCCKTLFIFRLENGIFRYISAWALAKVVARKEWSACSQHSTLRWWCEAKVHWSCCCANSLVCRLVHNYSWLLLKSVDPLKLAEKNFF